MTSRAPGDGGAPSPVRTVRSAGALAVRVVVSVLAITALRESATSRAEALAADAAAATSDWPEAIAHARAAAEAYVPGSPWSEHALRKLAALGHDAEARGDDADALLAYGAMRTAALGTRGPLPRGAPRRAPGGSSEPTRG